jgi:hypothetical protein
MQTGMVGMFIIFSMVVVFLTLLLTHGYRGGEDSPTGSAALLVSLLFFLIIVWQLASVPD